MSSTDALRPRSFRTVAARTGRVAAVALAAVISVPLVATSAHAATAAAPTCQNVGADQLGRDTETVRVEVGTAGLVLVRAGASLSLDGKAEDAQSITVVGADGHEVPGWGSGAGLRDEMDRTTYDHVTVCWDEPVAEPATAEEPVSTPWTSVEEPTVTPWTSVEEPTVTPWTSVEEPTVTPWTSVEEPTVTPWTKVEEPTVTPWTKVEEPTVTPWTSVEEPTSTPWATVAERPGIVPTATQPTTPVQPVVQGEVPVVTDSAQAPAATPQQRVTATTERGSAEGQAEAPARLVQTGASTMPLVVASTSLVVLGGVLLHLARPSRRPAARRRSAR